MSRKAIPMMLALAIAAAGCLEVEELEDDGLEIQEEDGVELGDHVRAERAKGAFCVIDGFEPETLRCFADDRDAAAAATSGALVLEPDGSEPDAETMRRMIEETPAPGTPLAPQAVVYTHAIFYSLPAYQGAKLYMTRSSKTFCTDGGVGYIANLANVGFDNRISSLRLYNGCYCTLYQLKDFEGALRGWDANDALFPVWWDNRASSLDVY